MPTQAEKARAFALLHARPDAFIIPNPWDPGTARLLAHLGFEALATTSAGMSFAAGKPDNSVNRDEALAHAAAIVAATDLPVSADLENGFGDEPEAAAVTIRRAVDVGLAGASIEDMSRDRRIYDVARAADRVRAAADAVRSLGVPFVLTARAENYLVGRPDLHDTIKRLQAYQQAGADVLYAPGLTSKDDIATVVRAVDRPVNVIMGLRGVRLSVAELSALGVKRISVGSALSRAALGAFLQGAREMREHGTFAFADDAVSYTDINGIFEAIPSRRDTAGRG